MANLVEATSFKEILYRGSVEGWTNVYIYRLPSELINDAGAEAIADEIVLNEKLLLSPTNAVRKVTIGTPQYLNSDIDFFYQKLYDSAPPTTAPTMDPERAILIQWPAGRNSKNRPVYLRKWYHPGATTVNGQSISSGSQTQQTQISTTTRGNFATVAQNLAQVGPGPADFAELVSPTDRERTGPAVCYPWLEHHELGDQWRS